MISHDTDTEGQNNEESISYEVSPGSNVHWLPDLIDKLLHLVIYCHYINNFEATQRDESKEGELQSITYLEQSVEYLINSKKKLIESKRKLAKSKIKPISSTKLSDEVDYQFDRFDSELDQLDAELYFYKAIKAYEILKSGVKRRYYYFSAVVVVQLFYMLLLVCGFTYFYKLKNFSLESIEIALRTEYLLNVPIFSFIWGFIGGICWCLYSFTYWVKRRMFNQDYVIWYMLCPIVSSMVGSVTTLVVLGGLTTFGVPNTDSKGGPIVLPEINYQLASILSIVSFLGGFSTQRFWTVLDSMVASILKIDKEGTIIKRRKGKI